jgi:hypothetical protein
MGIHSDTKEDNEERLDQFGFCRYEARLKNKAVPLPIFECSLCGLECTSSQSLSDHVQRVHAGQHVYVRANNIVISDHHYFDEPLKTLECVSIDVDDVEADVLAQSVQARVAVKNQKDLTDLLKSGFIGEVNIKLFVKSKQRKSVFLFFVVRPIFDSSKLDEHIFEVQLALERGEMPDWEKFESTRNQLCKSLLEQDYLNGFHEYSLAQFLEKKGTSACSKFEKAMTLLRKFDTTFARTVRYVLAIRNNLFQSLADCPDSSPFYPCRAFYCDGMLTLPSWKESDSQNQTGIYVDSFTEQMMLLVRAFYASDYSRVEKIATSLQSIKSEDPNNEHKLTLLLARTAKIQGHSQMARFHYQQLDSHPIFSDEAGKYLR